ncbi:MAG: type II secretion system F family protein [Pseudomonadota bacterium]
MIGDILAYVLQPANTVMILVALATFGAFFTLVMPFLEGDRMRSRMKSVASERERLKQQSKEQLHAAKSKARLREKPQGFMANTVDKFNLRTIIDPQETRDKLKMAGLRRQAHVVTFVFFRAVGPFLFGIGAFVYIFLFMPDQTPMMRLLISLGAGYLGFYFPNIIVNNLISRRQESIAKAWPDALDLLLICVEAGMSIEAAFKRVASEIASSSVPLAEEMSLTNAELAYLQERRMAFENLGKRTGLVGVKAVVTSLIQAERYGTPLGTALRVLAQENRDMRMAEAERKAAALPPKLTVPMITFFLPVIFVVILGPAVIEVMAIE